MNRIKLFWVLLLCLPALRVEAQVKTVAYPDGAEIGQYPIFPDTVGRAERIKKLGLHVDTLKTSWTGYNWYQSWSGKGLGRFVFETLSAGTVVLSSADGVPRYKEDCFNRLIEWAKCPLCGSASVATSTGIGLQTSRFLTTTRSFSDMLNVNMHLSGEMRLVGDGSSAGDARRSSWFSRNWGWLAGGVAALAATDFALCKWGSDEFCLFVNNVRIHPAGK